MRPERLYLLDIVEAADAIGRFLDRKDESLFLQDELLQSAVLQKLMIIGEAASRLPKKLCDRYSDVDWRGIVGFRNIAIHEYFSVEWSIVWVAATDETPALRERIEQILAWEFPDEI